jgi:hypothetical protein
VECFSIQLEPNEELVHIYYSALNFKDVMTATGRLTEKPSRHRVDLVRTDVIYEVQNLYSAKKTILPLTVTALVITPCTLVLK